MPTARKPATRRAPAKKTASRVPAQRSAPKVDTLPVVAPGERIWVLNVPWEEKTLASYAGARWNSGAKAFLYVGEALTPKLASYESEAYSLERLIEDELNDDLRPVVVTTRQMTPSQVQLDSVIAAKAAAKANFGGFLQADGTGRGKTLSITETIRQMSSKSIKTVLVVCPKGAIPGWRRTIADTEADLPAEDRKRWVVINYQSLKKLLEAPSGADMGKRKSTQNKRLVSTGDLRFSFDVVVADESQNLMNPTSQQSQAFARYAEVAKMVIWASATPGYNPAHFAYLARSVEQVLGERILPAGATGLKVAESWGAFLKRKGFSVAQRAQRDKKLPNIWAWEPANDQARRRDTEMLQSWLFKSTPPMAISRPSPPTPREALGVALTPEQKRHYESAWLEFRAAMGQPQWKQVGGRRVLMREPKGVAATTRFRQKCSYLRVPNSVEQIKEWTKEGKQVFVSAYFSESIDEMANQLLQSKIPVAVVDGRTSKPETDRLIRSFQTGEAKVIITSINAAISLHSGELLLPEGTLSTPAVRESLIHDPRFSPIDIVQIEGRCNRRNAAGGDSTSTCWYAFAEGTVEEKMVLTVVQRMGDVGTVTNNDELIDVDEFLASMLPAD